MLSPDYIFETSWEVCNRVGGIYAVLSTRAASMQKEHPDKVIFFGPDFGAHSDHFFREDASLLSAWVCRFREAHADIPVRVGRWTVPGEPIAVLLRADALWAQKDSIYAWAWENFHVQSHAAYGDYDESSLFGYAAGMTMASLYDYLTETAPTATQATPNTKSTKNTQNKLRVVAHANEWQTAFMVFYLHYFRPQIGTLFTTHATSIGRSIAGNGKPLYDYFEHYNGDQMAEELNMVSKHSAEKQAAHFADCFTTVSDLTARECKQLLDKPVDIVTPNGFEPNFVPKGKAFGTHRAAAREALTQVAEQQLGGVVPKDAMYICIAGRQEWKNKGIDVFLHSMERLGELLYDQHINREVIAFVMIPYLDKPIRRFGKVSVIFVPYYLNGHDPLFGKSYYDLLIGMDATVFPSYYEPWGYTPLESVAFHVPTITTTLAGFGLWAQEAMPAEDTPSVTVIARNDSNYYEVVDQVARRLVQLAQLPAEEIETVRKDAAAVAKKAEWRYFFKYYRQAYDIALKAKRG